MDTHVKVLGALQIAMGTLGLFAAVVLVLVFGVASSAVGLSGDPEATIALPIIGVTGMAEAADVPASIERVDPNDAFPHARPSAAAVFG